MTGKLPDSDMVHKTLSPLDLLDRARLAAAAAARYLRRVERPSEPGAWTLKGSRDFVTQVDRTAEQLIGETLLSGVADGRIVGEELSPGIVTGGLVWIVDPLDGTTNFLHGYQSYAVSIAAAVDGVLQVGIVQDVPRGDTYYGWRGGGAWLNQRRLTVSTIRQAEFALIGTGFPFREISRLEEYQRQFGLIARATSGIRRSGSAALDLADVAAGRCDGFWEQRLSAWDIAAGALLIREAGGVITDFDGRNIGIEHAGVVAGNPVVQSWLLQTLSSSR